MKHIIKFNEYLKESDNYLKDNIERDVKNIYDHIINMEYNRHIPDNFIEEMERADVNQNVLEELPTREDKAAYVYASILKKNYGDNYINHLNNIDENKINNTWIGTIINIIKRLGIDGIVKKSRNI